MRAGLCSKGCSSNSAPHGLAARRGRRDGTDETAWTWWTLPPAIAGCLAQKYRRRTGIRAGPQLLAGVCVAVLAAQPFAVEQVGADEIGPQLGAAEPVDRLAVQVLG